MALSDLQLPWDLGRYRLIERLGQGGYASVFRAVRKGPMGFTEDVAAKLVSPELAARDPETVAALADEASILRLLRHPHIVQFRDFDAAPGPSGQWHVLALEFVDGITLGQVFELSRRTGRRLPLDSLLEVLRQALSALGHAHDASRSEGGTLGLVHRDLKPDNLMIDREGRLRVLDFGIAWAQNRRVETLYGVTKGTMPWMSPEQILGAEVDGRADLYVLGAIAFELATGMPWVEAPAVGREYADVGHDLLQADWHRRREDFAECTSRSGPWALPRAVRKGLGGFLESLLRRERERRFETAHDALDGLIRGPLRWDRALGRKRLGRLVERCMAAGRGESASGSFAMSDSTRAYPPARVTDPDGQLDTLTGQSPAATVGSREVAIARDEPGRR